MKIFGVFFLMFLIACAGHSQGKNEPGTDDWDIPRDAAIEKNPMRYDVESVSAGKALFEAHCQLCHGYYGEGTGIVGASLNKMPANLLRLSGKQTEGVFAWKILQGRGDMPSFRNKLSKQEIWQLVNFIASLENEAGSLGDANYEK